MSKDTKKGRPPAKALLSVRIAPGLKGRLQEAADRGSRSITQEAEMRLERSFELEALAERLAERAVRTTMETLETEFVRTAGGPDNFTVAAYIGFAMAMVETRLGGKWREDEEIKNKVEAEILSQVPGLLRQPPPPWRPIKEPSTEAGLTPGSPLSELGKARHY